MTTLVDEPLLEDLIAFRRDLHRHPELSWHEQRTADQIESALRRLDLAPRRFAATGVVADLSPDGSTPTVALRADIDALPILEQTGLEFASSTPGVMHACGHDGHATMLLGAAHLLRRHPLAGGVRLIFQPAEEVGEGARRLVAEGVLDGISRIFAVHLDHYYPAGTIVVQTGAVNASTDGFRVVVRGRGGHAARPHEGVDALVVACQIVLALQQIVSRQKNPADPAVITVGRLTAGTAANVMAGEAHLEGTIRTLEPGVRSQLIESMKRVVRLTAEAWDAEADIELLQGTPPLINRPEIVGMARSAAVEVVGEENIRPLPTVNMGGEDFACYLEHVEGCFLRIGARVQRDSHPAHSPRFDIDEAALGVGAEYLYRVASKAIDQAC